MTTVHTVAPTSTPGNARGRPPLGHRDAREDTRGRVDPPESSLQRRVTRTLTDPKWAGQDSNLGPWGYEPPALTG